jgi:hypothetical protein
LLTSNIFITKLINIDFNEANNEFLTSKLALETVLDEKKKIEINARYKKSRVRLLSI